MEILVSLIVISLVTASISSMWLYSPLFSFPRRLWMKIPGLSHLAVCQICCSFWFAIPVSLVVLSDLTFLGIILYAFMAAVMSWGSGAWITNQLWQKAYYEKKVTKE